MTPFWVWRAIFLQPQKARRHLQGADVSGPEGLGHQRPAVRGLTSALGSCCLLTALSLQGFFCKTEDDFDDWCQQVRKVCGLLGRLAVVGRGHEDTHWMLTSTGLMFQFHPMWVLEAECPGSFNSSQGSACCGAARGQAYPEQVEFLPPPFAV